MQSNWVRYSPGKETWENSIIQSKRLKVQWVLKGSCGNDWKHAQSYFLKRFFWNQILKRERDMKVGGIWKIAIFAVGGSKKRPNRSGWYQLLIILYEFLRRITIFEFWLIGK